MRRARALVTSRSINEWATRRETHAGAGGAQAHQKRGRCKRRRLGARDSHAPKAAAAAGADCECNAAWLQL